VFRCVARNSQRTISGGFRQTATRKIGVCRSMSKSQIFVVRPGAASAPYYIRFRAPSNCRSCFCAVQRTSALQYAGKTVVEKSVEMTGLNTARLSNEEMTFSPDP